jgi:hypothetical protein
VSVLDVVRGLAQVGGAGFGGYAEDQQTKVRNTLAQQQAQRDAERDKVLNALTGAQTRKIEAPAPAPEPIYDARRGGFVDPTKNTFSPTVGPVSPTSMSRTTFRLLTDRS